MNDTGYRKSIGVMWAILHPDTLKRPALFLSQLAVCTLPIYMTIAEAVIKNHPEDIESERVVADLKYLQQCGVIFVPTLRPPPTAQQQEAASLWQRMTAITSQWWPTLSDWESDLKRMKDEPELFTKARPMEDVFYGLWTRFYSLAINVPPDSEVVPVTHDLQVPHDSGVPCGRHAVLDVVLSALPVPADDASWEAINDFRNDPDTREKATRLRRWMRQMTRTDFTATELRDELEALVTEYMQAMRLHKIKTTTGCVRTVLNIVDDVGSAVKEIKAIQSFEYSFRVSATNN